MVCIPQSSGICGKLMEDITLSLTIIKDGMVNFATNIAATTINLAEAAARGIYNFFSRIFGGGSSNSKCKGCVTPMDWWLLGKKASSYFFIRGGSSLVYNKWWGIGGKDGTIQQDQPLTNVEYAYWTNAFWWYVSIFSSHSITIQVLVLQIPYKYPPS